MVSNSKDILSIYSREIEKIASKVWSLLMEIIKYTLLFFLLLETAQK